MPRPIGLSIGTESLHYLLPMLPGMGEVTTQRVIDAYGSKSLDLLEEDPREFSRVADFSYRQGWGAWEGWQVWSMIYRLPLRARMTDLVTHPPNIWDRLSVNFDPNIPVMWSLVTGWLAHEKPQPIGSRFKNEIQVTPSLSNRMTAIDGDPYWGRARYKVGSFSFEVGFLKRALLIVNIHNDFTINCSITPNLQDNGGALDAWKRSTKWSFKGDAQTFAKRILYVREQRNVQD